MTAGLLAISTYSPARDRNGRLVPGARMDVFLSGTTTRATVYSDFALTTPLPNPVIANASGVFPSVWADGGGVGAAIQYGIAYSSADGVTIGNPSRFDNVSPGVSIELTTDEAAQEVLLYEREAPGAVSSPFLLKLTQTRDLTDFIDRAQWPAISSYAPTANATNTAGQDSFAAALADLDTTHGGEIVFPDGTVRLPPKTLTRPYATFRGRGSGSIVETTSTTADLFDFQAAFNTVSGLQVVSTVARTGGAFFRARNEATRFYIENIEAHGAYRLLQIDGHVSDPALDSGFYTGVNLRSYETVVGGEAFYVAGGYVVDLTQIVQAGDNAQKALTGLRVKRCADLRVDLAQLLNVQRPLLVDPSSSITAASFKLQHSYLGTSLLGSLISDAAGSIVSLFMLDVWAGETEQAGANGLTIDGAAGRIKSAELVACSFPLAQGDGLNVNGAKGFQMSGGWADGCGGSGMAFLGMTDAVIEGVRSGAERFGGNVNGIFESGNTRLTLRGNAHGNTGTNFTNGSGAISSIQVVV